MNTVNKFCNVCGTYNLHTINKEGEGGTLKITFKCSSGHKVVETPPFTKRPTITPDTPRPGLDYEVPSGGVGEPPFKRTKNVAEILLQKEDLLQEED